MATAPPEIRAEGIPMPFRFSRSGYPVILRQRNPQRMEKYGWMYWDIDSWGHFLGWSETSHVSGCGCTALSSCSSPEDLKRWCFSPHRCSDINVMNNGNERNWSLTYRSCKSACKRGFFRARLSYDLKYSIKLWIQRWIGKLSWI